MSTSACVPSPELEHPDAAYVYVCVYVSSALDITHAVSPLLFLSILEVQLYTRLQLCSRADATQR